MKDKYKLYLDDFEIKIKGWWWKRFFRKYRLQKWIIMKNVEQHLEEINKAAFDFALYGTAKIKK